MAKNYRDIDYFGTRPDVVKVWGNLEAYYEWCRIELREFDPSEMYRKDAPNYGAFLYAKRPRRPYMGNKPKWDNNNNGRRNEQRFSR